jgi:hypothetical protein
MSDMPQIGPYQLAKTGKPHGGRSTVTCLLLSTAAVGLIAMSLGGAALAGNRQDASTPTQATPSAHSMSLALSDPRNHWMDTQLNLSPTQAGLSDL